MIINSGLTQQVKDTQMRVMNTREERIQTWPGIRCEMCKMDVGTRHHQVTLGEASHIAHVKAAV